MCVWRQRLWCCCSLGQSQQQLIDLFKKNWLIEFKNFNTSTKQNLFFFFLFNWTIWRKRISAASAFYSQRSVRRFVVHASLNGCNFRCLLLENFEVLQWEKRVFYDSWTFFLWTFFLWTFNENHLFSVLDGVHRGSVFNEIHLVLVINEIHAILVKIR